MAAAQTVLDASSDIKIPVHRYRHLSRRQERRARCNKAKHPPMSFADCLAEIEPKNYVLTKAET